MRFRFDNVRLTYPLTYFIRFAPGIVSDARHLTSMARTAWGSSRDVEDDSSVSPDAEACSGSDASTTSEDKSTLTGGTGLDRVACNTSSADGSGAEGGAEDKGAGRSPCVLDRGLERGQDGLASATAKTTGENAEHSSMAASAEKSAYVPLHGLIFLLAEMHMKTPEEILEKVTMLRETVMFDGSICPPTDVSYGGWCMYLYLVVTRKSGGVISTNCRILITTAAVEPRVQIVAKLFFVHLLLSQLL